MNPYSDLLNTAQRDLETSIILHHAENYPAAVFYYQQAVEKACKFWGLSQQLITWAEIRKIGHNPDKVFRILFTKHIALHEKNAEAIYDKMYNDYCINATPDSRVQKAHDELYHITNNPVIPMAEGQSPYEAVDEYFKKDTKAAIIHPTILQDLAKYKSHPYRDKVASEFIRETEDLCKMPACLLMLSFIVFNTEQNARYPDFDTNIKPEDLYNKNVLLVKQLPFLFQLLTQMDNILHHYFIEKYKEVTPFSKSK